MVIRLAVLAILPSLALANDPPMSTPSTVPTDVTAEATAGSKALAGAIAAPVTTVAPEITGTVSPTITTNPSAVSDGDSSSTLTDSSNYDAWALALSLPTATAGTPGTSKCHVTNRGWSATVAGRSGGTYLDPECEAREHCKDIARLYLQARQPILFAKQLETCGGIQNPVLLTPPPEKQSPSHAEKVAVQKEQVTQKVGK